MRTSINTLKLYYFTIEELANPHFLSKSVSKSSINSLK